jgi:hypothetical protein
MVSFSLRFDLDSGYPSLLQIRLYLFRFFLLDKKAKLYLFVFFPESASHELKSISTKCFIFYYQIIFQFLGTKQV